MRILLTEKQSTIRELNRSLRGKSGQRGSITPLIRWIDYGANRVAPLAANIVAPLSANELAPYWCQSTIPNLAFEHLIVDYAYRTTFESFIDDVSCLYSGFQYGAGNGCPVKFYDKAFEQGGMFNGYSQYTRLEKLHKPNARGRKSMFRLSELHTQKYAFQGVTFYDPLILDGMPKSVFELIRREGIGKAVYLLTDNNRRILERKMCKYKLQASTDFKKQLIKRYQEKLYELQNLIATPHRFADEKVECA